MYSIYGRNYDIIMKYAFKVGQTYLLCIIVYKYKKNQLIITNIGSEISMFFLRVMVS